VQSPGDWPETIKNAACAYSKYLTDKCKAILKALTVQTEKATK
jgi:hypothetical protein